MARIPSTPYHVNKMQRASFDSFYPQSILRTSPWCPARDVLQKTTFTKRKRVRIANPEPPLLWTSPCSPDSEKKQTFIRRTVSVDEMKHIMETMNPENPPRNYDDAVEKLIDCSWRPTKEHIQRYDRLRATLIEHDDDEKTVEFQSGREDYLSTRSTEDLEEWLRQHHVSHSLRTRKQLIRLVAEMLVTTTPIRAVPRRRRCPKTVSKHNNAKMGVRSMIRKLNFCPMTREMERCWAFKLWVVYFLVLQGVRGWISLLLVESFHSKWTLLPDQVRVNLFLNSNLCFNLYCCGPIRSQVHSSFWCIFAMVAVYDSMGLFCSAFLPSARCGEFMPLISIIYCM